MIHIHHGRHHVHLHDAPFEERKHPRGNPENAGQFAVKGAGVSGGGSMVQRTSSEALPPHIAALKIPPAWKNVRYDPDPNAALLVVGTDAKGRQQRVYSEKFARSQAALKFARIREMEKKYGRMLAQNAQAQKSSDPKVRDSADCLALIMATGIRPGSERDRGGAVKAYGATTLLGKHVVAKGSKVSLKFVGKKGVSLDIPVDDQKIASMLVERAKVAGSDGNLFPNTDSGVLLRHTHTLDGGGFKTKDFRTYIGTKTAMAEIAKVVAPTSMTAYKKAVRAVAAVVARQLGNTPTVALQSYISPVVFADWNQLLKASA